MSFSIENKLPSCSPLLLASQLFMQKAETWFLRQEHANDFLDIETVLVKTMRKKDRFYIT